MKTRALATAFFLQVENGGWFERYPMGSAAVPMENRLVRVVNQIQSILSQKIGVKLAKLLNLIAEFDFRSRYSLIFSLKLLLKLLLQWCTQSYFKLGGWQLFNLHEQLGNVMSPLKFFYVNGFVPLTF